MAAPPPPPGRRGPPELMDELVEEILLRLPPDKPARLVRAALVCKRWRGVVMDPGFRRRFRQFHHRTPPPMLGFIVGRRHRSDGSTGVRFLPRSSSFRPSFVVATTDSRSWCPLDARHGRVLFYDDDDPDHHRRTTSISSRTKSAVGLGVLVVWTPATGEVRRLRAPPRTLSSRDAYWNAALLCVAPGCDHAECPSGGGPFSVVLVIKAKWWKSRDTDAWVYSSDADEWRETASIEQRGYVLRCTCSALVGSAIYFLQYRNAGITKYDLVKEELSVIGLPPICSNSTTIVLMSVKDGGELGFAMVDGFSLCVWVREESALTPTPTTTTSGGGGGWTWTLHEVVDLKSFPALSNLPTSSYVIAAADDVGVFVIWAYGGAVAIDVKSGRVKKLFRYNIVNIIPYMSFCTPALRAPANN